MVMRVGGLASGMDIDSIVEKLMQAERSPLYKLQQQKTKFEWQRDAYRNVNTKLKTFDTYLFDNFALSSNFVKKSTTITGPNQDKVSISANSSASGSLNISSIKSLASAASSGAKTVGNTTHRNAKETDNLVSIGAFSSSDLPKEFNFTVDGTAKTFKITSTDNVGDFVAKLKDAGFTNAKYNESTGKFELGSTTGKVNIADSNTADALRGLGFTTSYSGSELKVGDALASTSTKLADLKVTVPTTTTFKYTLNGEDKTIDLSNLDADSTIDSVLSKFNAEETGLVASFDAKKGTFSLTAKDGETLQVSDTDSEKFLNGLGVQQVATGTSVAFNEVRVSDGGSVPTANTSLRHLGILDDGKFKLNTVQADGKMKETIIEFKADDTISSLMKKINSSGAGVTALFSDGNMSISANNTGTNNEGATADIQLLTLFTTQNEQGQSVTSPDTAGMKLFKKLGFNVPEPIQGTIPNDSYDLSGKGSNAVYTVNGLDMTSQTNTANIEGYTIKLQGTFNETGSTNTAPISVTSANDTNAMMDKIKEFVTTYNGLIKDLNSSLTEKTYRDYQPLTAEQKEEMSEDEIKQWEEKAKSGLLRNDSIIREGVSKLRSNFSSAIGGLNDKTIDALSEIGITTSKNYSDGGTLEINETKLRAALEKDPDQVAAIFTKTGKANDTETDPVTGVTKKVDSRGLVQRLRESIDSFELNIERKAGRSTMTDQQYNIGKSMLGLDTRIKRLQDRLVSIEERYWKQFTAMETAINKANQQSSMFMSQG